MSNKYLIKLANMQKIFTRATKQPSSVPIKTMGKDNPQLTMPQRSVDSTPHRNLLTKQSEDAKVSMLTHILNGTKNFAVGSANVAKGTGTAVSRVGATLLGKGRNEAALQGITGAKGIHPNLPTEEINNFVGRDNKFIREYLGKYNPNALHDFNREANLHSASKAIALAGTAGIGIHQYNKYRDNQEAQMYQQQYY